MSSTRGSKLFLLVSVGKSFDPRVELIFRHVFRVVIRTVRLRFRHAFDEWFVVVEPRPWTIVDVEIVKPLKARRRLVSDQLLLERRVPGPYLPQEQWIEQLRRGDDLFECLPILCREFRNIGGQSCRSETCDLLRELRIAAGGFTILCSQSSHECHG